MGSRGSTKNSSSKKHAHKLKRHKYPNGEWIYFCTLDCNYRSKVDTTLGVLAECWRCGKPFNMNEKSIRLLKPHCPACTKGKLKVSIDEIIPEVELNNLEHLEAVPKLDLDSFMDEFRRTLNVPSVDDSDDADAEDLL
jgi:hypothetical protein